MIKEIAVTSMMLILLTSIAWSETILRHSGANDPVMEGWEISKTGSSVTSSATINDLGSGIDSWSINDTSTGSDSLKYYSTISPKDQSRIVSNGWMISVLIRINDIPTLTEGLDADKNSIIVKVRPGAGSLNYDLVMGYKVDDGQQAIVVNGIAHRIDTYALIEVEYTAKIGEAGRPILTMSINGTRRFTHDGASPNGSGASSVEWGASSSKTVGHAHWANLHF